jgi:hypothetical protein
VISLKSSLRSGAGPCSSSPIRTARRTPRRSSHDWPRPPGPGDLRPVHFRIVQVEHRQGLGAGAIDADPLQLDVENRIGTVGVDHRGHVEVRAPWTTMPAWCRPRRRRRAGRSPCARARPAPRRRPAASPADRAAGQRQMRVRPRLAEGHQQGKARGQCFLGVNGVVRRQLRDDCATLKAFSAPLGMSGQLERNAHGWLGRRAQCIGQILQRAGRRLRAGAPDG